MKKAYTVYMLKCVDSTFYIGVTTDLDRRVNEHNSSKVGARYTKTRRPVQLVYSEVVSGRSEAQKREYQLKQLSRVEKQGLLSGKKRQI